MYLTQQDPPKRDIIIQKTKDKSFNNAIPKQEWIKIHELQQFVGSIFTGCSMPPLDQFLELQIEEDSIKVKLLNYKSGLLKNQQQTNYIYYLCSGKIFLKKRNSNSHDQEMHSKSTQRIISASSISSKKMNKKQDKNKQKIVQVKQDSFFMLPSFKKLNDVQYFDIVGFENGEFDRCLFAKIKINPSFNFTWYLAQSQKHQFLSSFFQNQELDVAEHKLKGLSRFFKYDNFKRGAFLNIQNECNQRLFIIKSGQVQFSKSFSFNQRNHSNTKIIKVANGEQRTVIGSEFALFDFLGSSRSVTIAAKAMSELQNQKQRLNFKMSYSNINNFTVAVLSAYVQAYYISVQKFKQLCTKYVPQVPQNLRKTIQGNYITLLRTTKQKLDLQLIKISRNQNTSHEQRALMQAKLISGHFDHELHGKSNEGRNSPLRVKKSEFIQTNLQQEQVEKIRTKRLEKKIQLLLDSSRAKVNYKKKIEIVLKQKLAVSRVAQSPQLQLRQSHLNQSPSYSPEEKNQMKKDIHQIFTNFNSESKYRSNNIEKQTQMIAKKQLILQKRYSSTNNMLIVHQDFYDKDKNKLFRMDLIRRGALSYADNNKTSPEKKKLNIKQLSDRIKKDCLEKINKANKIKEQFMTIRSECEHCHCYDDIEGYVSAGAQHKDLKSQTMRTGMAWRKAQTQAKNYEEPLEKLHSRNKLISEKAARKYHHNEHLQSKKKRFSSSQRKLSGVLI